MIHYFADDAQTDDLLQALGERNIYSRGDLELYISRCLRLAPGATPACPDPAAHMSTREWFGPLFNTKEPPTKAGGEGRPTPDSGQDRSSGSSLPRLYLLGVTQGRAEGYAAAYEEMGRRAVAGGYWPENESAEDFDRTVREWRGGR